MGITQLVTSFPATFLILCSVVDVSAGACLLAGGLDFDRFLEALGREKIGSTECADVWILAVFRLVISLVLPPGCSYLSHMDRQSKAMRASRGDGKEGKSKRTQRGASTLVEEKTQGKMQGWTGFSRMTLAAMEGTFLLCKAAFLLIFESDAGDELLFRWLLLLEGCFFLSATYILQGVCIEAAWSHTSVATMGEGLKEGLLEEDDRSVHLERECREAGRQVGVDAGVHGDEGSDQRERSEGAAKVTAKEREEGVSVQLALARLGEKRGVIWRLLGMTLPDWPLMATALLFLGIAAVAQALIPKLTGDAINDIVLQQSAAAFSSSILNLSIASFTCAAASGLRGCSFLICASRINVRLRRKAYAAILRQEIAFFDQHSTGDLTSRLQSDTAKMSDSISLNLNVFFRSLVQAIGVLALMFALQWRLTLVTFMAVPLIISATHVYGAYYKTLTSLVQDCQASSNSCAEEAISSMRTVRSFANEDQELADYGQELSRMLRVNNSQALAYLGYGSFVTLAPLITTITVLYFGGYLVLEGVLKPGDLVSFVFYQQSLSQAITSMGDVFTGLMQAAGAADKVFAIIDRQPHMRSGVAVLTSQDTEAGIMPGEEALEEEEEEELPIRGHVRFDNVSFSYSTGQGDAQGQVDAKVLDGVSFEALPGQVVALVGKSGSGKSSCMSLLELFYEPTGGSITIDSKPLHDFPHKYLHRKVSLVGQEPVLYSRSVRDNITFGMSEETVTDEQVERAARLAYAHDFICEMKDGYDTQVGEKGSHLSGGQKQRIAIARALYRDPAVLLLDEATSALDSESEALVQAAIDRSMQGRTVIVVAHRLSTIRRADKIIVMGAGRIVEVGSHNELVRKGGAYASLVSSQLSVESDEGRGRYGCDAAASGVGGAMLSPLTWFRRGGASVETSPSPQKSARRLAGGHGAL